MDTLTRSTEPAGAGPVLVCVGSSPTAEHLLREGRIHARRLGVGVVAAHVRSVGDPAREDRALHHLRQAQSAGARVIELSASDVVEGLLNLARAEGASLVVLGKPVRGSYRWPEKSIADRFVEGSRTIPVLLVGDPHPHAERHHVGSEAESRRMDARHLILLALCLLALAAFARVLPPSLSLLLAAIAAIALGRTLRPQTATLFGLLLGLVPAVHVAIGASPQTSPLVYLVVAPTLVGLIGALISRLQARIPEQEQAILEREGQLSRLHAVGTELAAAASASHAWAACVAALEEGLDAIVARCDVGDVPKDMPWASLLLEPASSDEAVGCGTAVKSESPWLAQPVRSSSTHFGWLVLDGSHTSLLSDVRTLLFVGSVARLLGVTLERLRLGEVAEERNLAAAAERMRSDLLSSVSHDLRTPLGTIVGAASWLRESHAQQPTETTTEFLASIEVEARRLERTLENLLALTRLSGQPEADRSQWVIEDEIVHAGLERLGKALDRSRVTLHLSKSRPLLAVDALLIELALANLVDNALRHGGPQVAVVIRSSIANGVWTLVVEDNGPGIPFEERDAVFERFFRGRWGRTHKGSGMGLAICRAVAEAHGGNVHLVDPGQGDHHANAGTRVRLMLPTEVLEQEGVEMEPTSESQERP